MASRFEFYRYVVVSVAILAMTITYIYIDNGQQFFPTCITFMNNNMAMLIFYNTVLMLAIIAAKILQRLFFGPLRAIEMEHMYEKSWYCITETCLAMTIFKDEFNGMFIAHFTLLLITKIFHWISHDRIDFMEQTPHTHWRFHIRIVHVLTTLAFLDAWFLHYCLQKLWSKGPSMLIMFCFEYVILMVNLLATISRYIINVTDQQLYTQWDNKSMYIFYLDLVSDFLRLSFYMGFFSVILYFYGLPLHIIRDLYLTSRSFTMRVRDLIQYRRATANMNEKYPDATPQELRDADSICIICREEMLVGKKLPCGHIFHFQCLRSWLERQQVCPTCRSSIFHRPVVQERRAQEPTRPSILSPTTVEQANSAHVAQSMQWPNRYQPTILLPNNVPYSVWVPVANSTVNNNNSVGESTSSFIPSSSTPNLSALNAMLPINATHIPYDQLRRLEGTERENLEERIKYLVQLQDQITNLITQATQYKEFTETRSSSSQHESKE